MNPTRIIQGVQSLYKKLYVKQREETRWKRITGSESAHSGLKKVEGRMAFTPEVEERTDVAKGELRKLHIEL